MPAFRDRCKETTTTTGTGAITLAGAVAGFDAFSACFDNPSTVYYAIVGTTEWEIGIGTFTTTLSRDVVLQSSNSDALVSFSAGTKNVFSTVPAAFFQASMFVNAAAIYAFYQSGNDTGAL